jgi:DNA polymerase (family 10)
MIQNSEVAKVLDEVADMLELAGENFFRVRAYRNAARTVHDQPIPVANLSPEEIDAIPGIGADLVQKIATIVKTGELPLRQELAQEFPPELLELRTIPGLGPKRLQVLIEHLGIRGREDLQRAARSGKLRTIKGFGRKIEEKILESLARREGGEGKRILYAEAARIAARLVEHLSQCRAIEELEVAGSFRRRRETVGDLDVLVSASNAEAVMKQFRSFPEIREVVGAGETKTSVFLRSGLQLDLRVVTLESFGAALIYFTGSKAHNIRLRRIAQSQQLLLNEYGLFRGESAIAGRTEEEVYHGLGLPWITPELREDHGEIEAAAAGGLPRLISRADLRGDLHAHSTYTDGRASIEEMARAAAEAGLQYLAITDHSRRVAMDHGLDAKRLREQWRKIFAACRDGPWTRREAFARTVAQNRAGGKAGQGDRDPARDRSRYPGGR